MRGKLTIAKVTGDIVRITPAGAGKTNRFGFNVIFKQDHPRRCGENV